MFIFCLVLSIVLFIIIVGVLITKEIDELLRTLLFLFIFVLCGGIILYLIPAAREAWIVVVLGVEVVSLILLDDSVAFPFCGDNEDSC